MKERYDQLKKGMTLDEVEAILGEEGEIVSGHTAQIEPGIPIGVMDTQIREWELADGSVVRVMFGAGIVREKTILNG
jgi:hypothetical protein